MCLNTLNESFKCRKTSRPFKCGGIGIGFGWGEGVTTIPRWKDRVVGYTQQIASDDLKRRGARIVSFRRSKVK